MEVLSTETEQVRESEGLEVRAMSDLAYSETEHRSGFPGGSDSKASAYTAGDLSSIPALGRPPGEGNDNPLQYSCLESSMDRGAWRATIHGVANSQT